MKKKVLVCGATGFIGHNTALSLADLEQYEVSATYFRSKPFEDERITFLKVDLQDQAQVNHALEGIDIVVLAAATTSGAGDIASQPHIHVTDNVILNSMVFRAAWEKKVEHLIFFSCTVMYASQDQLIKETDFDANQEMYPNYFGAGWMKVYMEKQAEFFSRLGGTRYTVLRHSNIYGPFDKYDMKRSHVFGATVNKVLTNEDGKIAVWGAGKAERDLLYVDDLVNAVELCMEKQDQPFALFNVGLGKSTSVADLVQKIIQESGKEISIEFDLTKPDFSTKVALDCSKIQESIGWQATTGLEEGIQKTLAWCREHVFVDQP